MSIITELPEDEEVKCKQCTKGMSRDEHGNCEYCKLGEFQPNDLDDDDLSPVACQTCSPGSFTETILDYQEFEKMPEWLNRHRCSTIMPNVSMNSCEFH